MKTRDERDEKWAEFEEEMKRELEAARKRFLLAEDFREMEQITREIGQRLQQQMLEAGAEQREVDAPPACPECGGRMQRKGKQPRQVKTTTGTTQIDRERWSCSTCKTSLLSPRPTSEIDSV